MPMRLLVSKYSPPPPPIHVDRKLAQSNQEYNTENSEDAIKRIKDINISSNLCNFGLVRLFTSTPVADAIGILESKLLQKKGYNQLEIIDLTKLLQFINEVNFLQFSNTIDKECGITMDLLLSSTFTEIIMQQIEICIIPVTPFQLKLYIRYVVDLLTEWTYSE